MHASGFCCMPFVAVVSFTFARWRHVLCAHTDLYTCIVRILRTRRKNAAGGALTTNRPSLPPSSTLTLTYICRIQNMVMIYTRTGWAKKRGHRLMTVILSNLNRFTNFLTGRFLGKFAVKMHINKPHHTLNM